MTDGFQFKLTAKLIALNIAIDGAISGQYKNVGTVG